MQRVEIEARFNSILERFGGLLRNTIASHCPRDLGVSFDDIFQEVSVRLWRSLLSEREIGDLASYLHRIAANATIDALRRVKARREEQMHLSPVQDSQLEPGSSQPIEAHSNTHTSPEAVAQYQELIAIMQSALNRLPENRQCAVRLHLQGFTTAEIAELMSWSEAKARNLVYRGLADLRVELHARGVHYEGE